MAGTGKSTISRTVARSRSQHGDLGGSFFFKRGETDRGNLAKFCPTLARQLATNIPALATHVKDAIDDDTAIVGKSVREQFDKLILRPLSKVQQTLRGVSPLVIVVDALDECEQDPDVKLLIDLFSHAHSSQLPRLRILVTSRPELPVRLGFSAIEGTYQDLILHEIPAEVIETDIRAFFHHELGNVRDKFNRSVAEGRKLPADWPGEPTVQRLVTIAVPLFIFAATVCRFIDDRRFGNPKKQLQKVLSHVSKTHGSQLDMTYGPVLNQHLAGISGEEEQQIVEEFGIVVGTIVILARPLSASSLSRILDVSLDTVDDRLDMLHSVLSVPSTSDSPVRLLHLSFRDYVVNPRNKGTTKFWVDENVAHRNLMKHCLRIMRSGLRENICSMPFPGARRYNVNQQKVDECSSPELQYACLYWVHHRTAVDHELDDGQEVYDFLTEYFLHWLELMSLMGRSTESLGMLKSFRDWLQVCV